MAGTAVDFLLEGLENILSCSGDCVLAGKDKIESLLKDLQFIRDFLNHSEDKFGEHENLTNLVVKIRDVACDALDFIDSCTINALKQKKSGISRRFLRGCSPNIRNFIKLIKSTTNFVTHIEDGSGRYDIASIEINDLTEDGETIATNIRLVFDDHSPKLRSFIEDINSIKRKVMDIYSNNLYAIGLPENEASSPTEICLSRVSSPIVKEEETVVGFDDKVLAIKERLVGQREKLDIISIVGMGGIGKTTLARELYNDPLIRYRFHIRGWTYVSQVYQKKDLFVRILSSVVKDEDEVKNFSAESLEGQLYRRLKGQKYLIVVDDIWNVSAWEDLRKSFPNDNNGSRIILTTRLRDLAMKIKPDSPPHYLQILTPDESWDLFRQKAFGKKGIFPLELMELGKKIAAKCRGLPLAIVVVARLLAKKEKKQELWKQVVESVSSNIAGEADQIMDILALSYKHLPQHLKGCFLYFGAFPEDYEIPVWRLTCLWIAEGFVKQVGQKSLEDVAKDYLMDLIDRSLVLVSKKSSNGGIKVCGIHDMLRDLCLRKAKEKNYLQQIDWYGRVASPSTSILHDSLCFHSHGFHYMSGKSCSPCVMSRFSHMSKGIQSPMYTKSCIYKLLRVLNLWCIYLKNFPDVILQLFHLRYLELHVDCLDSLPPLISNLWNLESLIIDKEEMGKVTIPPSVWNMVKLRHLRISEEINFEIPCANHGYPPVLDNLQSISALPLSHCTKDTEMVLARTPNLRKLAFYRGTDSYEKVSLPDVANLIHLDTLKLIDNSVGAPPPSIPQWIKFPANLKKLTLSGGHVDWREISNLGKLPNLEVLKLRRNFFSGPRWETSEGEFLKLKYLKLTWMDLEKWITSNDHFPGLERLVLQQCMNLEEIPSCLGDIPTLEVIDISGSSKSAANSAKIIQEDQYNLGNDGLKISIYTPNVEDDLLNVEDDLLNCFLYNLGFGAFLT